MRISRYAGRQARLGAIELGGWDTTPSVSWDISTGTTGSDSGYLLPGTTLSHADYLALLGGGDAVDMMPLTTAGTTNPTGTTNLLSQLLNAAIVWKNLETQSDVAQAQQARNAATARTTYPYSLTATGGVGGLNVNTLLLLGGVAVLGVFLMKKNQPKG